MKRWIIPLCGWATCCMSLHVSKCCRLLQPRLGNFPWKLGEMYFFFPLVHVQDPGKVSCGYCSTCGNLGRWIVQCLLQAADQCTVEARRTTATDLVYVVCVRRSDETTAFPVQSTHANMFEPIQGSWNQVAITLVSKTLQNAKRCFNIAQDVTWWSVSKFKIIPIILWWLTKKTPPPWNGQSEANKMRCSET